MAKTDLTALADYFHYFANVHVAETSPLYACLARKVASDEGLLAFAAKATPGQPSANLLLAAVQYLLREGPIDAPLRAYYPTLGGTRMPGNGDPAALFERFVGDHQDQILPLLSTKITNTNEIGRCGVLILGFAKVAEEAGTPLHMIEIGPSAGLNLCWDHYRYRHGTVEMGPAGSAVLIEPELRGDLPLDLKGKLPSVASRVGLELNPVPLDDVETLAWQLALIFPEHVDRAKRIARAFGIAMHLRPKIIEGDAVELIADVIASLPQEGAACVYHSQTTYQMSKYKRAQLPQHLAQAGRARPIWRVGFEWLEGASRGKESGAHSLGLARYAEGTKSYQHLAFCDPHGRWIEWEPALLQETDLL